MRPFLAALTFAALGLVMGAKPSRAEITYPWCAQYGMQGTSNCGFATLQQCRAALSGNGGYCEQNPMYRPSAEHAPGRRR